MVSSSPLGMVWPMGQGRRDGQCRRVPCGLPETGYDVRVYQNHFLHHGLCYAIEAEWQGDLYHSLKLLQRRPAPDHIQN